MGWPYNTGVGEGRRDMGEDGTDREIMRVGEDGAMLGGRVDETLFQKPEYLKKGRSSRK